ncbi:MAG: hypothetical protein CO147_10735, partial [Nitrospirae bacterium CG_4_9_14_3_um_filter_44_28]
HYRSPSECYSNLTNSLRSLLNARGKRATPDYKLNISDINVNTPEPLGAALYTCPYESYNT